jgi:hypothetical protein
LPRKIFEFTDRHTIEERVSIFFAIFENPNVLEDLKLYLHSILIPNGVLAQEIEMELVWCLQRDVLASQRTTADGIGFIFALLVTCSQCQSVNEVHCGCSLSIGHQASFEVRLIILTDSRNVLLEVM